MPASMRNLVILGVFTLVLGLGAVLLTRTGHAAPPPPPARVATGASARSGGLTCAAGFAHSQRQPRAKLAGVGAATAQRVAEKYENQGGLNDDQMDLYVYERLRGAVGNGGFYQFFTNNSGRLGLRAKSAIARIGPPELIPLYDCVLTAFPDSKPSEEFFGGTGKQLDAWGKEQSTLFLQLDNAFYDLDLDAAEERFVTQHPGL